MALFRKKDVSQQQPVVQGLDLKQVEAALNQVVLNTKKAYESINARLDRIQSDVEKSFVDVGSDFESLSKDVQLLKSIVAGDEVEEDLEVPERKLYKRITPNEVKEFESEKDKKKALLRKR